MPKTKLTFDSAMGEKLKVAAHFSNVRLGAGIVVGNELIVEADYKDGQSLVKLGGMIDKVKGNELQQLEKQAAEKAAAKDAVKTPKK